MPSLARQIEILGVMAAHESAAADLYRAYAGTFPDHADLFHSLAAEEVEHARIVTGFADRVRAGSVSVQPGRFSAASILASLDYVQKQVQEAKTKTVSLLTALSTSVELESNLIECKYFEVVEADTAELKELLQRLAADFERHRDKLRKERERAREAAAPSADQPE